MQYLWTLTILTSFFLSPSLGQSGFDCPDANYRVLEIGNASLLQKIVPHEASGEYTFEDLKRFDRKKLNAISYYQKEDLIYGFNISGGLTLLQIDAQFDLTEIKTIDVPSNLFFVAADINQVAGLLYILGYNLHEPQSLLLEIDLKTPGYPVRYLPVFAETAPACADLVYHPASNSLVGFDHKKQMLIELKILPNRVVVEDIMPPDMAIEGGIPSLFYDKRGHLLGIGSNTMLSDYNIYEFSLQKHSTKIIQRLSYENNQDACSCGGSLLFTNLVESPQNSHCNPIRFRLNLTRLGKNPGPDDISISDTLPAGFVVEKIKSDQAFKVSQGGPGFSHYTIDFHHITFDSLSIVLEIKSLDPGLEGVFYSQAKLKKGDELVLYSDNPRTLIHNDATDYQLESRLQQNADLSYVICEGDSLWLNPALSKDLQYKWSDEQQKPAIIVRDPGLYYVHAFNDCEDHFITYSVSESRLQVDLGSDLTTEEYESIKVESSVFTDQEIRYFWTTDNKQINICTTCRDQDIVAKEDFSLELMVISEDGCVASGEKNIKTKSLKIYQPNAFTPNGDGINDLFQLYSDREFLLKNFQIFDRWGQLIYSQDSPDQNDKITWNGSSKNLKITPGVYLWTAILIKKSGEQEKLSGEINLVL